MSKNTPGSYPRSVPQGVEFWYPVACAQSQSLDPLGNPETYLGISSLVLIILLATKQWNTKTKTKTKNQTQEIYLQNKSFNQVSGNVSEKEGG